MLKAELDVIVMLLDRKILSTEDIITLEYDDETAEECGILGVFDALGKEYIALNPLGSEDVYIYGYKEHGEDYELIDIKDDEEFEKVVAEFEKLAAEEA